MENDTHYPIRDYRHGDFPQLDQLWKETGMGAPERGDNEETIERCNQMGGKLLVMTNPANGKIIGSSWLTFDGRRIFLHHFGIKPEYQNRGLGKQLANATLQFIREKGYQVKLEVHKDNHIAKRLYEKSGFFAFTDYDIYMIRDTKGSR
ncbi:MAG TPA: GNAT family N-acetyltransferase [Bacteroidales bacterium]|nr:GNAT family N-acetyltransferase [Bacteroidales bacterium]